MKKVANRMMKRLIGIKKSSIGTLKIEAKFNKMCSPQDFTVCPVYSGADIDKILIESALHEGYISMSTGIVTLGKPVSGGSCQPHLIVDKLDAEELAGLKSRLDQTDYNDFNGAVVWMN